MKYNFSEKNLGPDFCKATLDEIWTTIQNGISFTLLGMPLSGMAALCRYLAATDIAYFAYIDTQSLKHKTRNDLFLSLYNELEGENMQQASLNAFEECKKQLRRLILIHERIVIAITRLDYLKKELSKGLLADFKALADIGVGKVVFIGSSRLPFYQISPSALVNVNPSFMTSSVYLIPFQGEDFNKLYNFFSMNIPLKKVTHEKIYKLSGGHASLILHLLKTDKLDNPLDDEIIQLHLQTIYDAYFPHQQSQLRKMAAGKDVKDLDPFLMKIGIVKEIDGRYELFTPLLRDYILQYTQTKLSKKEKKLFSLFKKSRGKLVTKDGIFEAIWPDDDNVTEASLTSLLYRLRKNQSVVNQRYVIENEKGEGYRMVKKS